MNVLVTGGAGYIGSHTVLALQNAGFKVHVLDNFINSKPVVLERLKTIGGKDIPFTKLDLLDKTGVDKIFAQNKFDAVIHFAGLKAVGESVSLPLMYYQNNLTGTINLLEAMQKHDVSKIVFSSSATVYGDPASVPIRETFPLKATNPYGQTKLFIEQILTDWQNAWKKADVCLLRYFNPIGAHESGLIGEDPNGIPNNLVPFIAQVAVGRRDKLSVFGDDWKTPDGTGVRDYIHVTDLAQGHVKALQKAPKGVSVYNLGTGRGQSVLEVLKAYEKACGKTLQYQIVQRRPGDIAACYADPSKAQTELGWKAELSIDRMCADSWNWQSKNPNGYV